MDARIDRLQRVSADDPSVVSLGGGLPAPELFPRTALAAASARALRRDGDRALQYGWPEGRATLRAWVAARLRARRADVDADDVIITSGAQQAIAIATELLVPRGGVVALEPESYPGALDTFRAHGSRMAAGALPADAAYLMPTLGNPGGARMSRAERAVWLAWSRRHQAALIEDDAYGELSFDGRTARPLLADDRSHVWHVGTFSKTLCPGLRVGWLIPPRARRADALETKRVLDLQSSGLTQSMLGEYLDRTDFDARLERARRHYHRKAEVLAQSLAAALPEWEFEMPAGGFSIWLQGPDAGDATDLLDVAIRNGVSFDPGCMFRVDPADRRVALRLCYSLESTPRIRAGVQRLARAWKQFRRARSRAA